MDFNNFDDDYPIMIFTERLQIRPVMLEDAPFILELMNTKGWLKYIGDRHVHTLKEAAKYIREKQLPQYERLGYGNNIVLLGDIPIGTCGLYQRPGLQYVDIGFAFLPAYHGHGYAFEAATAVIEDGVAHHGISIVQAITLPINVQSIRLIEKLGLRYLKKIKLPNDEEELSLYQKKFYPKTDS